MNLGLHHGDLFDVLPTFPDNHFDSVVTDPPYDLTSNKKGGSGVASVDLDSPYGRARIGAGNGAGGFMGMKWDSTGVAFNVDTWREVFRVMKPGAHLIAFGGTRTCHRMTCAIEDAGFEIRDSIAWLYGSGFPKSLDVSKAIDAANGRKFEDRYALGRHIKARREACGLSRSDVNAWFGYKDGCEHWERQDASGARVPTMADWATLRERLQLSDEWLSLIERSEAEREVIGKSKYINSATHFKQRWQKSSNQWVNLDVTSASTTQAKKWAGWGTALKPAFEPIVVARKPFKGTIVDNVLTHGTGGLNIDACRIESGSRPNIIGTPKNGAFKGEFREGSHSEGTTDLGRWPANVVIDEVAAASIDEQTGDLGESLRPNRDRSKTVTAGIFGADRLGATYPDSGGASRFYYCAKPSREERDMGCYGLTAQETIRYSEQGQGPEPQQTPRKPVSQHNIHPTVKPVELMRWLVKLVTPVDGIVLDPFTGSGTTGMACAYEQRKFVGVEREAEYVEIAKRRIASVAPLFNDI